MAPVRCCPSRGSQLAVTETARGGILRRGIGVAYNDVSVVTNVTADHLGLGGIDTVDQLAEVKAVVTKITRPRGWCVVNGDDPRTFAMRLGSPAKCWVFSRDPDSPSIRTVLDEGGRATTVLDGFITVLDQASDAEPLLKVVDVPMTLSGLSHYNVENALAAASAALGLGLPRAAVIEGLSTFAPNENNPGRMNMYSRPRLHRRDRPGPQRGRPRGAARDHERRPASRADGCCSPSVRRGTGPTTWCRRWVRSARGARTGW